MAKRTFTLTQRQVSELWRAYDDCTNRHTRTRCQAVRLYGTGYSLRTLQDVTGCSASSLREWVQVYRDAGVTGLTDYRTGGNSAKRTPAQRDEIAARLEHYTPDQLFGAATHTASGQFWTVEDLAEGVSRWFGVQDQTHVS